MRRSKRAKRRLIVVASAVLGLGIGAAVWKFGGLIQHQRLMTEARATGLAAYQAGDMDTALENLNHFFTSDKSDLEVNLAFADARSRLPMPNARHLQEAVFLYETYGLKLLDLDGANESQEQRIAILERVLDLYESLGAFVESRETADRILAIRPRHRRALGAKIDALFVLNETVEVIAQCDAMIELEPDNVRWRRFRLEAMRRGSASLASMLQLCDQWAAGGAADGRYTALKAAVALGFADVEQARGFALAAAHEGAVASDVLTHLVSLLDYVGENEAATTLIEQTQSQFPDAQWVREAMVRRYWQAHRLDESLTQLAQAAEDFEQLEPDLMRLHVLLLAAQEKFDQASEVARALIDQVGADGDESHLAWANGMLAWIDPLGRSWTDRLQAVGAARDANPGDAPMAFVHGHLLDKLGEHHQALQAYRDAMARDANWLAARVALVEACLRTDRAPEAYQQALALLHRAPAGSPGAHLLLSRAYLRMLASGNDPSLADRRTGEVISVTAVLEALHETAPDDGQVVSLLCEAYVRTGHERQARQFLEGLLAEAESGQALLAAAQASRRFGLNLEDELLDRAESRGADRVDVAFARAVGLAAGDREVEGLRLIDIALTDGEAATEAWQRRLSYLEACGHPALIESVSAYLDGKGDDLSAALFVLSLSGVWEDEQITMQAIERVESLLGADSQQVKLARANALLRFHDDDEASLAEAMVLITDVLRRTPESFGALTLMARASLAGRRPSPTRAIEYLERAAVLYPGEAGICVQLVSLLQQQGDFDAAERYLAQLNRLASQDAGLRDIEFALLRQQGDLAGARTRALASIDQTSPVPEQLMLAGLHERVGDRDEAEAIYRRLLESHPTDRGVLTQTAHFYAKTGRFERGEMLLERFPDEAVRLLMIGDLYEQHGRVANAEMLRVRAVEVAPRSVAARHRLARHYLKRGEWEMARTEAEHGLEIDGEHLGLQRTLRLAKMVEQGGHQPMLALLTELAAANPDLRPVVALFEQIPVVQGRAMPTDAHLRAARELVRTHSYVLEAWQLAYSLHADAGRMSEAIDLARRAVGRFPADPEPSRWATQLLINVQRWDEALFEAEEWSRRTRDNPLSSELAVASILLQLGRAHDAVQRLTRFEAQLNREVSREPQNLALWIECLANAGEVDRAMRTAQPLLDIDPRWRQGLMRMTRRIHPQHAFELLTSLSEQAGAHPLDMAELAEHWLALAGRVECEPCIAEAESLAQRAVSDPQARQAAQLLLGSVAEARGDLELAERRYRELLAELPQHAVTLNNLAWVLAQQGDRADEALLLIDQALAIAADHPDFLDTRAATLKQLGRFQDAKRALQRALQVRPGDPGITLNLIDVLLDSGDTADAERWLTQLRLQAGSTGLSPTHQQQMDGLARRLQQVSAAGS